MNKVIILGSARKNGNTSQMVSELIKMANYHVIDLNDYNFSYFDYEHNNKFDDFIPLMKKIIENYDVFVFATPVYWYAMSGIMKVFFDRITDLLTIDKGLGRKLRGKHMAVISSSNGNNLGENFWLPFKEIAQYLNINYIANLHTYPHKINDEALKKFVHLVNEKA